MRTGGHRGNADLEAGRGTLMSIVETNKEGALALLRRDVWRYYAEVIALARNMPPVPRKLFAAATNPGLLMVVEDFPHGRFATVCEYEEAFVRDCLAWLRGASGKYRLAAFDERVIGLARADHVVGPLRRSRSFVCTSVDRVLALTVAAAKLTPADRDAFRRYPVEPSGTRPPLPQALPEPCAESRRGNPGDSRGGGHRRLALLHEGIRKHLGRGLHPRTTRHAQSRPGHTDRRRVCERQAPCGRHPILLRRRQRGFRTRRAEGRFRLLPGTTLGRSESELTATG